MFELSRHIETLLLDNDCVIVPGFGGFVAYNTPAKWCEEELIFLPPSRMIGFNPQLRMNDGLLVQSFMKVYDTNFSDATKILEVQINRLIEKIHEDGKVELENIGEISYSILGSYTFVSYDNLLASPVLYGFDSFEILNLSNIPLASTDKVPVKSPVNKNRLIGKKSTQWRNVAGIAAISIIGIYLFLKSTPAENTYIEKENYAQMFPSEILSRLDKNSLLTTYVDFGNPEKAITDDIEVQEKEENLFPEESTSENFQAELSTAPVKESEKTVTGTTRIYNIIAASVSQKTEAEKIVKRLKSEGFPDTEIINGNSKYRISIRSFSTREEAETELRELRKNPSYQSYWLLTKYCDETSTLP